MLSWEHIPGHCIGPYHADENRSQKLGKLQRRLRPGTTPQKQNEQATLFQSRGIDAKNTSYVLSLAFRDREETFSILFLSIDITLLKM